LTKIFNKISGKPWKDARRLFSPVFSTKNIEYFTNTISRGSNEIVKDLMLLADGKSIKIGDVFGKNFVRILSGKLLLC